MSLNIVLYRPEIPPNTGNIGRLCVSIDAKLHIVGKPSFDISESAVKRAGLDYWKYLSLTLHNEWDEFQKIIEDKTRVFLITKFGKTLYTKIQYQHGDYLVFGRETSGLPDSIKDSFADGQKLSIPMKPISRSINLSNSVAIVAFEALRQIEI